jgi:hypothetical protein
MRIYFRQHYEDGDCDLKLHVNYTKKIFPKNDNKEYQFMYYDEHFCGAELVDHRPVKSPLTGTVLHTFHFEEFKDILKDVKAEIYLSTDGKKDIVPIPIGNFKKHIIKDGKCIYIYDYHYNQLPCVLDRFPKYINTGTLRLKLDISPEQEDPKVYIRHINAYAFKIFGDKLENMQDMCGTEQFCIME